MLIDTHAHVNFKDYKDDGKEVIRRSLDKNIWMINVGSQSTTSARAVKMAEEYNEGVYAAIGVHPVHLTESEVDDEEIVFKTREERFEAEFYQKIVDEHVAKMGGRGNSKIVAMGEIGLDYYRLDASVKKLPHEELKKIQKKELIEQMKFSKINNLPLIVHTRDSERGQNDAYGDLVDLFKANKDLLIPGRAGSIHCYVGTSLEIAKEFVELGFLIGFTGIVTFGKNSDYVREIVKGLPLDKILVETDCPYLSPEPHRGERNEPAYVEFVARKIAEVKGVSFEEVREVTTNNAKKLFNIK